MTKIIFDEQEFEVPEGLTILQAAKHIEKEIPVFCYHDRLSIAGNCRMCLVEVSGSPKPVASCAMPIAEGMVIKTTTEMVKNARKGVLEFLLINHPLDCPICDQGGECDLQDITVAYGPSSSRFNENKRAVPKKEMGNLISTYMTRCIHCTRCVRFATDVAGVPELGAIGRGEDAEITTYLDRMVSSELSGNIIDLCPVGALTSKPYAFKGRPWELNKTESIDVMDAVGANIRLDSYRMQVMRILPRLCEHINEEWLSDHSRFSCDGLLYQRLDKPYIRNSAGKLQPSSWADAFEIIHGNIKDCRGDEMAAISGPLADAEAIFLLKEMMEAKGCKLFESRESGLMLDNRNPGNYSFNSTIAGIDSADVCLLIGTDIRKEAPLIGARLRKRYLTGELKVAYMGEKLPPESDLTHLYDYLGDDISDLENLILGKGKFAALLKKAKKPMIIVGEDAIKSLGGMSKISELVTVYKLVRSDWNGYNFLAQSTGLVTSLHCKFSNTSYVSIMDEIINKCQSKKIKFLYNYGVDNLPFDKIKNVFMVYQGHHGDQGAMHADVILPGAAYTEKDATYVNIEGRAQRAFSALSPPGDARVDYEIIKDLASFLAVELNCKNLLEIRARLAQINTIFRHVGEIIPFAWEPMGEKQERTEGKLQSYGGSFYQRNVISFNSVTMAKCAKSMSCVANGEE